MNTKKIISQIDKLHKQGLICREWTEEMHKDGSLKQLCKMWFDGSDWSTENNFPDLSVLKNYRGESDLYGLFTDRKGVVNALPQMAFFGESDVTIKLDKYAVCQIYIRHNSRVKIITDETVIVEVNMYDSAKLEHDDRGNINIYQYKK